MNGSEPTWARSRPAVLVAGVMVLSMAVAACNGSEDGGAPPAVDATAISMPPASKDIDTLTWDLTAGEPGSIDPLNAYDYSADTVISNLCEPLFRIQADRTYTPALATKVEQVDDLTQVYTIRSGVRFWDGKPLTNVDVAYSLGRNLDPSAPSHFLFTAVRSIEPTGENQVTVRFRRPDELFQKELAFPFGAVVEKAFAERVGSALGTSKGGLMCTGPFELDKWTPGSSISLSRNDDYWDPAFRAHAAKVKLLFVSDTTALTQGLLSGELDGGYQVPVNAIKTLRASRAGTLSLGPSTQSENLLFLRPDGPLADPRLRQALNIAIDREGLARAVYFGAATPNYTLIPTNTWDPEARDIYQAAYKTFEEANKYDLDKAAALVKSSSYQGESIVLATSAGDATSLQTAQFIQQQAEQIGLNVEVRSLQPIEYSNAFYDKGARKGIDFALTTFFSQTEDPLETLASVLVEGQTYNYLGYDNPIVTEKLQKAAATVDAAERSKLVTEAQSIYEPEVLQIALLNLANLTFVKEGLTGATTSFAFLFQPSLALIGGE